jgi:PadR family transcriptional regulator PadR
MEFNKDLIAASSTPLVLAILSEGDSYGYAIIKRVQELSGGQMDWTDGMLYPVLHRLERLGYIKARWEEAESGRRRKYYRITSQGKAQLAEERRQWQAVDATLRGIWKSLSRMAVSTASLAATAAQLTLEPISIAEEKSHEKQNRHHRWFCLRYDWFSFNVQIDLP